MFRMCLYMHSRFVENHPIRMLEDGPLISEGVLSQALEVASQRRKRKGGCMEEVTVVGGERQE
jgi:hypothetical protein